MMRHAQFTEPVSAAETVTQQSLALDDFINKALADGWKVSHVTTVLTEEIRPNGVPSVLRSLIHTVFLEND